MQRHLKNILKIAASFASFILLLGTPLSTVYAQTEAWSIDSFDAVIEIQESGEILVTETISATFNDSRRGIFRTMPEKYVNRFGNRVRANIHIQSVLQDGERAQTQITRSGGEVTVRIGNPNIYLTETHIYEITYSVKNALLFFDEYDELYWNVTGHDWKVPINNASAIVKTPGSAKVLQTSCYVGVQGSTSQNCGVATTDDSAAFAAQDFLTVAVGFEKGIVAEPTLLAKILLFTKANWPLIFPTGIILFALWYFWKHGKDPKMKTVIPEYEPPNKMQAVYTGVIAKDSIASSDLTAMIIQLAVQGYFVIDIEGENSRDKKKTFLERTEKEADDLDDIHKTLLNHFFKGKNRISLLELQSDTTTSRVIQSIRREIKKKLEADRIYVKYSFARKTGMLVIGVMLIWATFFFGSFLGTAVGIAFAFSAITVFILSFFMSKKTLEGVEIARHIAGFKLFMHTAERYRSQWQEKERIFETFLPYAIAFRDTKHWASIFADMGAFEQPTWYRSALPIVTFDTFTRDLDVLSSSVSATVAPPSSSGSSGGGSSGGGFGGGGGGSW